MTFARKCRPLSIGLENHFLKRFRVIVFLSLKIIGVGTYVLRPIREEFSSGFVCRPRRGRSERNSTATRTRLINPTLSTRREIPPSSPPTCNFTDPGRSYIDYHDYLSRLLINFLYIYMPI